MQVEDKPKIPSIENASALRRVRWRHIPPSVSFGPGTIISVVCLLIFAALLWRQYTTPTGPRSPAVMLLAPLASVAFAVGVLIARRGFDRRFRRALLCPRCHYTIEPTVPVKDPGREVQCPECGLRMTTNAYREAFLSSRQWPR